MSAGSICADLSYPGKIGLLERVLALSTENFMSGEIRDTSKDGPADQLGFPVDALTKQPGR